MKGLYFNAEIAFTWFSIGTSFQQRWVSLYFSGAWPSHSR